jgi:hypothetical protein
VEIYCPQSCGDLQSNLLLMISVNNKIINKVAASFEFTSFTWTLRNHIAHKTYVAITNSARFILSDSIFKDAAKR